MSILCEQPAARPRRAPAREIESDTQLGNVTQLAQYMKVTRSYLQALKRCAKQRHSKANQSCFSGNKSTARWVLLWLERNRDFRVTLVYRPKAADQSPPQPE